MSSATDTAKRPGGGPTSVGRYVLHREIASGGMATVYLGRMAGPAGFARVVAIKKMHDLYAADPELVSMFIDEASLAARIQHPNVAATLDVVAKQKEIFIVMDYVHGEALATLLRTARKRHKPIPVAVAASILCGVLDGLHAAHTARGEGGEPLHIVHRDVSPQNILVGPEGLARVVDFGVAKAASRLQDAGNADGRGKLGYTAPERLKPDGICDARADIFSVGVIAWEMIAGRRLFTGKDEKELLADVLAGPIPSLAGMRNDVSPELWSVLARGLVREHEQRWETAEAFARAIEDAVRVATARTVGAWVLSLARETMEMREQLMRDMEHAARGKRTGSHADAMSVDQLVEEIEAKSGEQKNTSRPPPALPSISRQSDPSIHSGDLPSTSGVRVGMGGQPRGAGSSPGIHVAAVPEDVVELPLRAGPSRRHLAIGGAGIAVVGLVAFLALRGGDEASQAAPVASTSQPSAVARSTAEVVTDQAATAVPAATASASASPSATASAAASASAAPKSSAAPEVTKRVAGPMPTAPAGGNTPPGGRPGYIPDAP